MWESMRLIEKANNLKKRHHQKSFPDQFSPKNDTLKSLSFTVYSSRHLISNQQQNMSYHSDDHILPPIDNRSQRKKMRPSYRTSLYHPNKLNSHRLDLSSLTARGTKSELLTTLREDELIKNYEHHLAPPPSPSDDQIERLLYELTRTRNYSPCPITTHQDGDVPYRLPALTKKPSRRTYSELTCPSEYVSSTTSHYFDTFY